MEAKDINTVEDMQRFTEGCVNDFESGICTKEELLKDLKEYTFRIVDIVCGKLKE